MLLVDRIQEIKKRYPNLTGKEAFFKALKEQNEIGKPKTKTKKKNKKDKKEKQK